MDCGNFRKPVRRKIGLKNKTENRAIYLVLECHKKIVLLEEIEKYYTFKHYIV